MATAQARRGRLSDRMIVLLITGAVLLLIVLFSVLGPAQATNDRRPTSYNSETLGIKASYLLLSEIGYKAERWESPTSDLRKLDAPHTTLVVTEPVLPFNDLPRLRASVAGFLARGGRVVATGRSGAMLLPGGQAEESSRARQLSGGQAGAGGGALTRIAALCQTTPEGTGPLAHAGSATVDDVERWSATGPQFHVGERCGDDAVVVSFRHGRGEAVWWSSPLPMTNVGLGGDPLSGTGGGGASNPHQQGNLRLLLASVGGPGRTVLFDEYLHEWHDGPGEGGNPLPWWFLVGQCALLAGLLVLSRSRRSGPLRQPLVVPRTSPAEFAYSMGHLYERARASQAAVDAAHSRLLPLLQVGGGVPPETLRAGPAAIADALRSRFDLDFSLLERHLEQVAAQVDTPLSSKGALKLVKALEADARALNACVRRETRQPPRPAEPGSDQP